MLPVQSHHPDSREGPYLSINGMKVHSRIQERINDEINGTKLVEYWRHKQRFTGDPDNVDWSALAMATKSIKVSEQTILTKLLTNRAPTAYILHRKNLHDDSLCPICRAQEEREDHIYKCGDQEVERNFESQLKIAKMKLRKGNLIEESTIAKIIQRLKAYRRAPGQEVNEELYIQELQEEQRMLGSMAFFNGIFHINWRNKLSGVMGTRLVIRTILEFRIQIWKHRCNLVHNRDQNQKRKENLIGEYKRIQNQRPRSLSMIDRQ